ncbi:bifunctional [glutamine synthetase] adenylyltransferase/[glutamine synthetase]-adenylyl-L-tyrosine phosphorylase [Ferrovibrio terrae]|uniref:Bifunctional glutamine synthetase adenylyltransferase/adenylyl-removing enzyme n=1 Tax=Ferrovibrio terrae TaxID=2594003 RepID=A0A516H3E2_9PROT|nr:bifunctional [glutamine synthetase] adenylyltransferase/[glutamine synthetase]-adenylyl-L-tyrosine phosphorylase [Ferrovibrio terrae]
MPANGLKAKSAKRKAAAPAPRKVTGKKAVPKAKAPKKTPAAKPKVTATAVKRTTPPAGALPQPFDIDAASRGFAAWRDLLAGQKDKAMAKRLAALTAKGDGKNLLAAIFGNSPFLGDLCLHEPTTVLTLLESGPDKALAAALAELKTAARKAKTADDLALPLRIAKRQVALSIAAADITGRWSLEKITGSLSDFAAACVDHAFAALLHDAAEAGELVLPDKKNPCKGSGYFALGMGKLGARELNYSSDIDLIVLFDPEVATYTGRRSMLECFIKLTRQMVRLLHDRTEDGYVFRTDLRLRPDPGSFPVAVSTHEAEAYYESFGQNWERAAMIKARPIAGDLEAGAAFLKHLTPYVWRKNLDFAAIEDIHSIKRQIHAHRGHGEIAVEGHNIKVGRGGIREIEFFAQTQQLIAGGRDTRLRSPATCDALRALVETDRLTPEIRDELIGHYRYLRTVEHRLQMIDDEQTHTLPDDKDGLARLACFLGETDAKSFASKIRAVLTRVKGHYDDLFAESAPLGSEAGALVFTGTDDDPATLDTLRGLGFSAPSEIAAMIRGWHFGRYRAMRSERAREKLTAIMPQLLEAFSRTGNADVAFKRFDYFLSSLPAGVQLFALLQANPEVLDTLAEVLAAAPQLAEALAQNAALFDSLIEYAEHPASFERDSLVGSLQRQMQAARDFQDVLDWARRWTTELKLQVGIGLLRGGMDGQASGLALSTVADAVLADLLRHVTAEFVAQHGRIAKSAVALVGLGRLGSQELTLESDLDLVLVFDCPDTARQSDGARPLTPGLYFARLCQRLIAAITAMTGEGKLYEIDMRLRPSGGAGPIAIKLDAYADYLRKEAWTWEHMALTRARVICGLDQSKEEAALIQQIEKLRRDILTMKRDPNKLLADVAVMRRRMAEHRKVENPWDLKQVRGGLVDLEFIVQYLLLRHGRDKPAILLQQPLAVLDALRAARLLDAAQAKTLAEAGRLYATLLAAARLAGRDEASDPERWPPALAQRMPALVQEPDMPALTRRLVKMQAAVHGLFDTLVDTPAAPHLALADSLNSDKQTGQTDGNAD